ncbi:alpha/beta hydrolase [Abyssibius alkaniclasticus]|uniref:alpha/beta hydrolase n=1 Tax=Abyssibius alkaniclasticus TaxID=2881234 RepID=UPI00405867BE
MSAAATLQKPETIRRRAVFVLPGYDPAPPRRYREIYRSEAAKQGEITGQSIGLSPVSRPAPFYGWQVSAQQAGRSTHSAHWILPWNDLVRSSMKAGIFGIYPLALRTGWTYLKGGALWALLRLRWQPMLAVFYPLAVLMGQVLVATAGAALGWQLAGWAGLALGLGASLAGAEYLRRQDSRTYIYYLLHLYAFAARNMARPNPDLARRMNALADQVQAALDDGVDEVLVVGHSLGAQLATDLLGDMLRDGRLNGPGHVALLTLGQVIPMMSFLPAAQRLRRNLRAVAASRRIFWLDVSSQADGGCFALADAAAVSGVAPQGAQNPLVISAAFADTVEGAETQRFFARHFQYYRAFARPENYDYFAITAGPLPLAARYAGRKNSPQCILKPFVRVQDGPDG